MVVLLVCDVLGGFIALHEGADTWNDTWGFETKTTVPLPIAVFELGLAWLAARNVRPPIGRVAAVVLSVFCLLSVFFGLFDGDLIGNIRADGFFTLKVLWALLALLPVTAVVGLLARARAKQLRGSS